VPAEWADAVDADVTADAADSKLEKMVKGIMEPVGRMDGDSLPVSAFVDHADGTFEQGASAFEKRGVAVMVPEWNNETCAQCNRCAFICPHATIRPYAMDEAEVADAPEAIKYGPRAVNKVYKYTLAVSPFDCMGCGVCVGVCPTNSLKMVARESQDDQQAVFDYCVAKVTEKPDTTAKINVISSQYKQPLLEFSGSCAGCAETSYARLITQLFGDRMYISNATGCSSIWGGPAATSPYTVNKDGHGPAWANSLFEDNAEHGLGMFLGQRAIRDRLIADVKEMVADERATAELKAAADEFFATLNDGAKNTAASKALLAEVEKVGDKCPYAKDIIDNKEYLSKKSVWIFGGDGWAYDIGFGGVDHVLATGEDVNIMVFDTEVYSNTGGQASKASNIGQVAQFAAAGKAIQKKSLADIAISYGYIYVAQIAMGADMNQTLKAIQEAEAYPGPSLIIGYAPCEMHSIKGGMQNCQKEMQRAVACGYWNNFRYDPRLKAEGKNPFILDSKAPTESYRDFIMNEARYSALTRSFPERAEQLFEKAEKTAEARYETLTERAK
ncbi:MAG: 4Fe-4S binding protein, partial [Ruminococcus sp.]|nr:4Fe-4S binding protein [Ruminococcus sp.]